MDYIKIFKISFIFLYLIQLNTILSAQHRLQLDRQFLYPGEQIGYTYINQQQEQDNLLYLVIVDLENQEIVDFAYHDLKDKIVEGTIVLDKDIAPGYYALFSAKYGDKEMHYEQFWVRDQFWYPLGGQEIFVSDEGNTISLKGRISNENSTINLYLNSNPSLIENPVTRNGNGDFEVILAKDSVLNSADNSPVWATAQIVGENDRLAIHRFPIHWPTKGGEEKQDEISKSWFSITKNEILAHTPEVGEFSIEAMGEIILTEDPLFPEDTIAFNIAELPTGKLILSYKPIDKDEYFTEVIWNYPQIPQSENIQRITTQSGEEITLNLPEIENPFVSFGNHFLSAKFDNEARVYSERHRGTLPMMDTLNRTMDVIVMQPSDPTKPRANRSVMFTNGEYLLDFRTDEKGEFQITRSELDIFGYEEGRLRYREEERKVRLEPKYPAIEMIKSQMSILIGNIQPMIIEKNELLTKKINEIISQDTSDDLIELDEVIVTGQTMEARIEEVLNDPFAIDWLNEDWVCQHSVINGGLIDCEPVIGNHPSLAVKIPLHLVYNSSSMRQQRANVRSQNRGLFKLLRGQTIPPIILGPAQKRQLEAVIYHNAQLRSSYTWDPDDYEDQIGSLKLPKVNQLIVTEDEFQISNGQKVWQQYTESPEIKVKAPTLPGTYILEISYWDLEYEISTSVSYEVTVR